MKLDAGKFGLAAAAALAVIWIICSIIVLLLPGVSMMAGSSMMHADFGEANWNMHFAGFLAGLVLWPLTAGAAAWLTVAIYNRMLGGGR
jgi:hypothetical protein